LIGELGDILVSDKARAPGKERFDFSTNKQQDIGPVCPSLHSYNQEVRADIGRPKVTRKERERLYPQQDIGIANLNHNHTLAQKVQLGQVACVRVDHICMDTREVSDWHSSILTQVNEPQLHNLLECASDFVGCPIDVLGTKALNLLQSESRGLSDSWGKRIFGSLAR